jgi:hypothetical protein
MKTILSKEKQDYLIKLCNKHIEGFDIIKMDMNIEYVHFIKINGHSKFYGKDNKPFEIPVYNYEKIHWVEVVSIILPKYIDLSSEQLIKIFV